MTEGKYKAYPEYRDSGVEWVGEIPISWEVCPLFSAADHQPVKNDDGAENNVLSLSYGRIIKRNVEANHGLLPASFDTYQIVENDDLILRLTDLQNDWNSLRVGLSFQRGIITSAYLKLTAKKQLLDANFFYRLLHSYDTTKVFYGMGGGLRQSMKFGDMRRLEIILPSLPEQIQIARFLDHKTGKIDFLIEKQQELIALLKEKRQAVISHAVTKGLNPQAPLKDSGIEWLGQVPEHWKVPRLKFFLIGIDQGKSPECEARLADDGEWGVLKSGCVNHGIYDQDEHKALPARIPPATSSEVFQGDLLMSRASGSRDLIGSVAYVSQTRSKLLLSDKIFRLKPIQLNRAEFIWKALGARPSREQIELSINGAEGLANNITKESIKNLSVALPPTEEQEAIAKFLSTKVGKIDSTIKAAETQITLLQERRTALISAAVTGKIDVRDWKPLPEETT